MYLHIGNGKSVKKREIIGIFDLDTSTVSRITKNFINENQRRGKIEYSDSDLPRAFILLSGDKRTEIRLSRISTLGLKQRLEGINEE